MVLHPKYANEIRNIEGLGFSETLAEDFHANVLGFGPFTSEKLILDVIRTKLTKKLGKKPCIMKVSADCKLIQLTTQKIPSNLYPRRQK